MPIRIELRDRVLTVINSRSEVRNAVDPEYADTLYDAFVAFDADEAVDVAIFWGEGGAFCAGADLKSLAARGIATPENASTHRSLEFPRSDEPVPRGPMGPSRLKLSKPVISRATRVTGCKLGLATSQLREWHITLEFETLTQMEEAFSLVSRPTDPIESFHDAVNSKVEDMLFALYPDSPSRRASRRRASRKRPRRAAPGRSPVAAALKHLAEGDAQ